MQNIMVDLAPFQLSPAQLTDVRDQLSEAIEAGLAADGQAVAALPAYLRPPPPNLRGEALVVDTGGTNMRAAWIEFRDDGMHIKAGPESRLLDVRGDKRIDRAAFFRMQAELVEALSPPRGLPVGYCFSYPSEVMPDGDARLIKWTKGIDLPDVVGTRVGQGLADALVGLAPSRVSVLNDTVAALMAAGIAGDDESEHGVGLIVGTGTNMACYTNVDEAPKLAGRGLSGVMAINLESGNFTPPHLNAADDIVDRQSIAPGEQRFEKALSGFYLPFIFQAASGTRDFDPHAGTQVLVDMIESAPDSDNGRLAQAIIDRAADLVGAGLAGVIGRYQSVRRATILAEGSLFWRGPGFANRAQATLRALLPENVEFDVQRVRDANLFGAAAAVLS